MKDLYLLVDTNIVSYAFKGDERIQPLQAYVHLFPDMELCRLWGQVRARCRAAGRPISPQDAWIGATALLYELPLVTHDPDDFKAIEGLTILTKKP